MNSGVVDRREARQRIATAAVATAWFGALLLRSDDGWFTGVVDWLLLTCYVVLLLLLTVVSWVVPAWRRKQRDSTAQLAALREHRDPGPDLRTGTDALARQYAGQRWLVWGWPVIVLLQVPAIDWARPARAVVATALFLAVAVTLTVWYRRLTRDALRWLADPPGPERAPALGQYRTEAWTAGWRLALVVIGTVVVCLAIGVVVGLAVR